MNERLECHIAGRVQMVMFRDFTCRNARSLGLRGIVKNLEDGGVEVIAEGPREKLEQLLVRLHKGPLLAHVERIEMVWHTAKGDFGDFRILYT